MPNWNGNPSKHGSPIVDRKPLVSGRTLMSLDEEARSEVTVDVARVLTGPQIECKWRDTTDERGYPVAQIWVRDASGSRLWHRIEAVAHHLVCNCQSYKSGRQTVRLGRVTYPSCKHISGGDGVSGAAGWLDEQAARLVEPKTRVAFSLATYNDPHRLTARRLLQERAVALKEIALGRAVSLEELLDI